MKNKHIMKECHIEQICLLKDEWAVTGYFNWSEHGSHHLW